MTISPEGLAMLIYAALALTVLAPLVLVGLWFKDIYRGTLW